MSPGTTRPRRYIVVYVVRDSIVSCRVCIDLLYYLLFPSTPSPHTVFLPFFFSRAYNNIIDSVGVILNGNYLCTTSHEIWNEWFHSHATTKNRHFKIPYSCLRLYVDCSWIEIILNTYNNHTIFKWAFVIFLFFLSVRGIVMRSP